MTVPPVDRQRRHTINDQVLKWLTDSWEWFQPSRLNDLIGLTGPLTCATGFNVLRNILSSCMARRNDKITYYYYFFPVSVKCVNLLCLMRVCVHTTALFLIRG